MRELNPQYPRDSREGYRYLNRPFVIPTGFEAVTPGLENPCSIHWATEPLMWMVNPLRLSIPSGQWSICIRFKIHLQSKIHYWPFTDRKPPRQKFFPNFRHPSRGVELRLSFFRLRFWLNFGRKFTIHLLSKIHYSQLIIHFCNPGGTRTLNLRRIRSMLQPIELRDCFNFNFQALKKRLFSGGALYFYTCQSVSWPIYISTFYPFHYQEE